MLNLIYDFTEFDRTLYDVIISILVKTESGRRKYRLQRDSDVRFLLLDQTVVPEVYFDLVDKVVRDVRDQPAIHSRISQIPSIVHGAPNLPPFATVRESVPSTQQLPRRREVPIWDGEYGFPETCEADEQERVDGNDSYASDGDEIHQKREVLSSPKDHVVDTNSDSDLDGQDVTDRNTEGRNQYTNTEGQNQWHCGTSRQTFDAIPSHWVLPLADKYSISSNRTEGSTSKVGFFYKGQIFDTKQKLKNEFGNYALNEKFNPRIRRSTKNRFEAGCNDIKCDFALRVTCRDGCTYWVVKKFAHVHTCTLDTYESHFRKVSSIVVGEMFAPKFNTNGRTIRPIDILAEMREQYGVQLLYTKAWRTKKHAYFHLYGKPEDSYQLLPTYFHLLKVTNHGTLVAIHMDLNNNFLYAFFALALSIVYPNVPHCICFSHLKQNLKPRLKGRKEVLDVYYKAAYCSTSRQFNLEMDEIKKIHQGTYDTLMSIGPERWSRSQCPGRRNKWSLTYNVYPIELTRYLVKDGKHDGLVDIEHRTCTCCNWDLDQLPCDHAIAVPSKRQAGRPKERRIPSVGEVHRQKKCSNCGEQGHNRMGCSNPRQRPNNGQLNTSISVEQPIQLIPTTRRQRACSVCHVLGYNRKTYPLVDHSLPTTNTPTDGDTTHL
ncbi:hypothetical protein Ddye_012605 [Dipteronia dyeriana]|uniref:SWIM-type domain-containing protein n=1 Tax=Dipteronia dyeriana TaxID=168575 RepID=A0AAE0CIV0_9ROSI|nr:hypothetical protein Ddye_012605 [Dipteronia dyeriana]